MEELQQLFTDLKTEVAKVVVGHEEMVRELFICLLCGGHALIEGVPGLGKTLLVKTLSRVLSLDYSRIQFTPDLMPADILGTRFITDGDPGEFRFYKGPIFGQMILADEINRATPKTQSALLEAMQEKQVTLFGETHGLEPPFIVLATQNPLEMEGTYPLPEAQVDRFLFKLCMDFPDRSQLSDIIDKTVGAPQQEITPVLDPERIRDLTARVMEVPIAGHVKTFAVDLVMATHPGREPQNESITRFVRFGASPRGLQAVVMAAKVRALLAGRYNVALEDIRAMAVPALRHRVLLNLKGIAEGIRPEGLIRELMDTL